MMAKIMCVGIAVLDLIYGVKKLPSTDGKQNALSCTESGGGMAANAAVAIQRLGGEGSWCGRLGDDDIGRRIRDGLLDENVDVRLARIYKEVSSPHSIVLVDREGSRALVLYRPASLDPDPSWLPMSEILNFDAVLTDNRWIEGAVHVLSGAGQKGIPGILDADSASDKSTLRAVEVASHVIFSKDGLSELFDVEDPEAGLRQAIRYAPFAAVTMGADGVMWLANGGPVQWLPAFPTLAKETVGAGDIFHGAFTLALIEGAGEEGALQFASAAAALKCGRQGGRASFPRRAEVEAFLKANAV
jgi:sulfofructose kinase